MITITTSLKSSVAHVELQPPTPTALAVIKGIPRREWMPRKRCWAIPLRLTPAASAMFADAGLAVVVDGVVQRGNPFPALKAAMNDATWRKVSTALSEVLDGPDGDRRLHALLLRTLKAGQEDQPRVSRVS